MNWRPVRGWGTAGDVSGSSLAAPQAIARLAPNRQFVQFLPLILAQVLAILGLWRFGLARDQGPDLATRGCPARSREASRAAANASTA